MHMYSIQTNTQALKKTLQIFHIKVEQPDQKIYHGIQLMKPRYWV